MGDSSVRLVFGDGILPQNQPLHSFFTSGSSSSLMGSSSMVSFKDVRGGKRSERSFFCTFDQEENGDEEFDDYFQQPEKKRRLTVEQVLFLEKSFSAENKLEPERKIQLAKDLGLQPRQVAIWFQNRRARWKTKQLEKDYDTLQASYDSLKEDYESLLKDKEKLQSEAMILSNKLHLRENMQEDHWEPSNLCDQQPKNDQLEAIVDSTSENEEHHVLVFPPKQEELSGTKVDVLDVLDSYSSHNVDVCHSSFVELGDSSYALEPDHSDISQEDDDYLSRNLVPNSHVFSKFEEAGYQDPTPPVPNPCNFDLPPEDHASLFWSYWDVNHLKM